METEYLGYAAATLTTFAFLPQAFRMIRTRQARDISMTWAISMATGIFLWLCYGISRRDIPMISANAITFPLLLVILYVKVRSRNDSFGDRPTDATQRNQ